MSTLTSVDMNIDRSSTRLHAPPGGQSSICFGTYGSEQPVSKPTPRTSTNNIYGTDENAEVVKPNRRPSANNIYGTDENAEVVKPTPRTSTNNIYGTDDNAEVVKPNRRPSANNIYGTEETEAELEKKRAAARRPSNSQGMGNVMTHDENEAPVSARRVRQAPGGSSTFSLA
mmetsp:Transcript_17071/g.32145  ORF Transcript_17071/g.32145 Transcript_17071/m.32145 type:complete len:172 (-) Transcript_17071:240-755(-)|eukprot:CAMPEP_0114426384 /NCGR_PEP_ID=MMETSP0103-20121206/7771_1 /TAXON_ID=37642 ORGANISM="Paraphysomonas imperforata, Strain PA2" /NCGR_SAMPLE_ID=MMETSP0103 /ASSEMBLY_ACC=CAM_ASM_000201 /LENGTH=171 /DNA_ID=CAMNT_0001595345 /DNA_START=51 /DNA_END=566 /DNA_ORIENTATION=-